MDKASGGLLSSKYEPLQIGSGEAGLSVTSETKRTKNNRGKRSNNESGDDLKATCKAIGDLVK